MPFQPINFANIAPIGAPGVRDLVSSLVEGYKASQLPEQFQQQRQAFESGQETDVLKRKLLAAQAAQAEGAAQGEPEMDALKRRLLEAQAAKAEMGVETQQRDIERMKEFQNLIRGGGGGLPGSGSQPSVGGTDEVMQQQTTVVEDSEPQALGTTASLGRKIKEAPISDSMKKIDELWLQRPDMRDQFSKVGAKADVKSIVHPETGQKFDVYKAPSGQTYVTPAKAGRQPEDIVFQKEISKHNAEIYKKAQDSIMEVEDTQTNLDYMLKVVKENPLGASQVIGPLNSVMTKIVGSDGQRMMLGQLAASSGNITLQAAKSIKGAFTGRDQAMIKEVKPNVGDTYGVFLGKLQALKLLGPLVAERNAKIAQYIAEGKSPAEANRLGKKEVPMEHLYQKVEKMIKPLQKQQALAKNFTTPKFSSQEEAREYLKSLSPEQRANLRKSRGMA